VLTVFKGHTIRSIVGLCEPGGSPTEVFSFFHIFHTSTMKNAGRTFPDNPVVVAESETELITKVVRTFHGIPEGTPAMLQTSPLLTMLGCVLDISNHPTLIDIGFNLMHINPFRGTEYLIPNDSPFLQGKASKFFNQSIHDESEVSCDFDNAYWKNDRERWYLNTKEGHFSLNPETKEWEPEDSESECF
jgi:hypothetical protein